MSGRLRSVVLILLLGMLYGWRGPVARAQEADEARQGADAALQRGDYHEARARYKERMAASAGGEQAVGYFETFLATGEYRPGLQEVATYLQRAPADPYLLYMKGRLSAAVGENEAAEAAFRQALEQKPDFWRDALALAEVLDQTGRRPEAVDLYLGLYRRYENGDFRTAEALGAAGRAAAELEQFHDANSAFRLAYQLAPRHVENLFWWAELFREKYNDADAQRTYEEALALNPHNADVLVGYARAVGSFARQEELARQALASNPNSVAALTLQAELRNLDGLYEAAETVTRQALAVNPTSIPALAQLASAYYLKGDTTAYAEVEERALAVNPHAVDFYLILAENGTRRFRYPDAIAFGVRAVEVGRNDPRALASLGTSMLRAGQLREARRYLQASFDGDPFNLFVGNTLTLLDEYANFDALESEHFTLLIHQAESAVLGPALLDLAEACYDSLSARYPYVPSGKIVMEAYNDRDDFAVRVAGIPHLGLLGVSFGDVVALNTPRAQTGRAYNWARTLWHELAHTMAIGVSAYHVPRWFTEGLSVYEEQRARPEWGREMDLELFTAFDEGKLLPLSEIDKGFTRPAFPGQVLLSYYHASKVIAFIVDTHGFDAVTGILRALGEGHDVAASVQQVLGQDLDALDDAFRRRLREQRQRVAPVLAGLSGLLETEEEAAAPEDPAGNPFFRQLQEGRALLAAGQLDAAEKALRAALDAYPGFIGEGNPYVSLAGIYRQRGEEAKLLATLERYLTVSEYGAGEARELAALYLARGDTAAAVHYLGRSTEVEPYDLDVRTRLADLYDQRGEHALAVRERRAVLALDPVDQAMAYYRLATSLFEGGQLEEAKRAVLQSLELAPGYRDAQKLLLACVADAE